MLWDTENPVEIVRNMCPKLDLMKWKKPVINISLPIGMTTSRYVATLIKNPCAMNIRQLQD